MGVSRGLLVIGTRLSRTEDWKPTKRISDRVNSRRQSPNDEKRRDKEKNTTLLCSGPTVDRF